MSDKPARDGRATAYATLLPELIRIAREHGYALGVHGSMVRDLDLIAAPWTDQAVEPLELVMALKAWVGGWWWSEDADKWYPNGSPSARAHGRMAWSIHLTERGSQGPYIDVSVMPRRGGRFDLVWDGAGI